MNKTLNSIYNQLPVIAQEMILSSYSYYINYERYGKKFVKRFEEFNKNQWLSHDQLTECQNKKLRKLINHVYENVPYYRIRMEKEKLKPSDFKTIKDLEKMPVLTREDIKDNKQSLLSKNLSKLQKFRLVKGHTSGTTGSPLEFYWDTNTCVVNNAADWRQKSWAGIEIFERCAVLLGRPIVPIERKSPPYWRYNSVHKTLWLSSFHMTNENMPLYVNKLKEYKPKYIEGYPSTLYVLARFLLSRNERLHLKAAFTSSETLHPVQRETIEEAFNIKLFDFYALAERVVFATECNSHQGHHLNMDYGITEIVNESGYNVNKGEIGWITGTGLHNYAMPLIRYKTNDVTLIKTKQCSCGRGFPLIEDVTTKAEDIITTPDGRFISPSTLTHPFKPMENIIESQIIQEDVENIVIKIVRGTKYSDDDTKLLLSEMQDRVGNEIKLHIEFVESLTKGPNAKFRWVISKVPLKIE